MLKGMNNNYITRTKEYDYRFLGRLLHEVFGDDCLRNGCVKSTNAGGTCKYQQLDKKKFDFVKALFQERVHNDQGRLSNIYRYVNAKCASLRK